MRALLFLLCLLAYSVLYGQQFWVRGVLTSVYDEALEGIAIDLSDTSEKTRTNAVGYFELVLPDTFTSGELLLKKDTLLLQKIPIKRMDGKDINLGTWKVPLKSKQEPLAVFNMEDLDFTATDVDREHIGSVLQAQRDAFLNTAAFQFSSAFFRLRGLDNTHQEVRLNGIPMNDFASGRPHWNQWGGLNDFTNQGQDYFFGIQGTTLGYGGLLATTQFQLRPSDFRSGTKISQAFSNSGYRFRTMLSHIHPSKDGGPAFAVLFSRRWGERGYMEGTPYDAWSGALLLEHQWSPKHHSWGALIYTPNRRGKNAPLTAEVYALKGRQYNPYWGGLNGKARNARMSGTRMPMFFFSHRWKQTKKVYWQINLGYFTGESTSGRLLYNGHQRVGDILEGGGQNPDPVYYQRLPSYALRNPNAPDYTKAFLLQEALIHNGQLDWSALYDANTTVGTYGIYALYDDVQKSNRFSLTLQTEQPIIPKLNSRWELFASKEKATFLARPQDLLGAKQLWDFDPYAPDIASSPNNVLQAEIPVGVGDPFLYHYAIRSHHIGGTVTFDYKGPGWSSFLGLEFRQSSYRREGYFKNGGFPEQSHGSSPKQAFSAFSFKWGADYALTGRHHLNFFAAVQQRPPGFRNVFLNPREHQLTLVNPHPERGIHTNIGYQWQHPKVVFKVNGYWIERANVREVSFYFADGVGGDEALFVQEMTHGMKHRHLGVEASLVYQPIPEIKWVTVAALGAFRYANNPKLTLATEPTTASVAAGFTNGIKDFGTTYLKDYSLAGGPQHAIATSIHYEDPNYWRLSLYGNYFSNAFLDPNPLTRSKNLYSDTDGLPFTDYDPKTANGLLQQEQFPGYFLLNATAGKSWLINGRYLGFFISLQNLLNVEYKSGGYEQGRNANYRSLLEDRERVRPLFGPKYWWGRGTTYFTTFYLRF